MNLRPNEAQELYDAYASSDENYDDDYAYVHGYDGDGDAYEDCPDDDDFIDSDMCTSYGSTPASDMCTSYGSTPAKYAGRKRRRNNALAKERLFVTADIAKKSLRSRLSHASRYPKAPIPKHQTAQRIIKTARKMGK